MTRRHLINSSDVFVIKGFTVLKNMNGKIPKLNKDVMKLILLFVNNTDKLFKCSMRRRTQKYNKNKNTIKQDILFEIKYFF